MTKTFLYSLSLAILVSSFSCKKDNSTSGTTRTDFTQTISPNLTDPLVQTINGNDHYVSFLSSVTPRNQLVVFFGGTNSTTDRLHLFCDFAASKGFHVINLAYPNTVAAEACSNSSDMDCATKFRAEIAFGIDGSPLVSVNYANSIENRLKKLLEYLVQKDPTGLWQQYLQNGTIVWNKLILSGHSQGAGHAAYIAKLKNVNRVIMFSGPNDFSNVANAPFNWLSSSSVTPSANYYAFFHLRDDANPFAEQKQNLMHLGMYAPFFINKINFYKSQEKHLDKNTPIYKPSFKIIFIKK